MNNLYKVNFSIDKLSLAGQQKIYKYLIEGLTYEQKANLHIEVVDAVGGKHNIWDGTGFMPDGTLCKKCNMIDCEECFKYGKQNNK